MLTKEDLGEIKKLVDDADSKKMEKVFVTKKEFKKELGSVTKMLHAIQKSLDIAISYFDQVTTIHDKRIKRVETHLNLPPFAD